MANPAAAQMIGLGDVNTLNGFEISTCFQFENSDGAQIPDDQNPFFTALKTNQGFKSRDFTMVSKDSGKKIQIELIALPTGSSDSDQIVTFRDISKELEEENAQFEFISTASHEMRTPVASIEGYLGLALNPQTATIDERAKGYLEAAHDASQHLGRLFQDLLDTTKLDDQKVQPHPVPLELTEFVRQVADAYIDKFKAKNLNYIFGAKGSSQGLRSLQQPIYVFADTDFIREVVSNLIENAIKYTPEGKTVWVNVQSDANRAIFYVADTGIGISDEDLKHVFQKFYRVDNSQTREIGGTGLGLYLVKQKMEAMDGNSWAESTLGQGSTFYASLPRLSNDEYEKRKIAFDNELQAQKAKEEAQKAAAAPQAIRQPVQEPQMSQQDTVQLTPQVTQPAQQTSPQPEQPAQQSPIQPQPVAEPAASSSQLQAPQQTIISTANTQLPENPGQLPQSSVPQVPNIQPVIKKGGIIEPLQKSPEPPKLEQNPTLAPNQTPVPKPATEQTPEPGPAQGAEPKLNPEIIQQLASAEDELPQSTQNNQNMIN